MNVHGLLVFQDSIYFVAAC